MPSSDLESLAVYIPMDRRQSLGSGTSLDQHIQGTALFADISGFTPLTEALARSLGPQRGAEELTIHLNRVYDALIGILHQYRGSVIGFSGDAITCWFDGDDGCKAGACALAMQESMGQFQEIRLPDGNRTALAMKAALASGHAKRHLVGNPNIHIKDVLTGRVMDNLAAAEKLADRGQVVLDESVINNLKNNIDLSQTIHSEKNVKAFGVLEKILANVNTDPWPPVKLDTLSFEKVKPWLLEPVFKRLERGQGEFLAELRPAVALFVRFSGIDFERDRDSGAKLNGFIHRIQSILMQYDGSLIQLTTGDKGSYLYAAFGAPNAHEDDSIRAVSAALEVRELKDELDDITSLQIGISQGRMRTGAYGGTARRTYGVLGDDTNLAARLMISASNGQILISKSVNNTLEENFSTEALPPMKLKGKSEPIDVYQVLDRLHFQTNFFKTHLTSSPLVGRLDELSTADKAIDKALGGRGQIIGIEGEAGIGKSRLAAEIIQRVEKLGVSGFASQCQSFGTNTSYLVWHKIWQDFFHLDPNLPREEKIQFVEEQVGRISQRLKVRVPLLGSVLNLTIPDNSFTANFDAKLRKSSLEALIVDILRTNTINKPIYIVLEDCHWLDPLSHDLLEVIGRAIHNLPVLMIVDFRPSGEKVGEQIRVSSLPQFQKISLSNFSLPEARQFINFKIGDYLGAAEDIPDNVIENIANRSEGNPFYIEEIVNYLKDRKINPYEAGALENLDLPSSLHSLVLTRIDERTESQKATIKVASVIGRTFSAAWLWSAFPQLEDEPQVRSDLEEMNTLDLTLLNTPEPELTYIFKHAVTQEVAYESLPFASRSELHGQLGLFIENCCLDDFNQYIDLLAHHFEKSAFEDKKRLYLLRAGEMAQADYANESAISYYKRVLDLLPHEEKINVLLKLCDVYIMMGNWNLADQQIHQVLDLAQQIGDRRAEAWAQTKKADLLGKQGQYFDASHWIIRAQKNFDETEDFEGAGQIRHFAGTQAAQQGDFEKAKELYNQSLAIRTSLGDDRNIANLLNNLGVIARLEGDQPLAIELAQKALAIRREIDDKWAIAISLNNMGNIALDQGDYESARNQLEEAIALQREIGDRYYIANGLNNLANVAREEGDYDQAQVLYQESLQINRDLGAQWSIAYLLEDIGCLAAQYGEPQRALELTAAAATLRQSIGAQLSDLENEKLESMLTKVRSSLTDHEAATAWSRGGKMSLDKAIDYAMASRKSWGAKR